MNKIKRKVLFLIYITLYAERKCMSVELMTAEIWMKLFGVR